MKAATSAMILVGLAVLALYALALIVLDWLPGLDIAQPLSIGWTGAFLLGAVFAGWNLYDSALDMRAAYRRGQPERVIAGGFWRLRSDLLQGAACLLVAAAGALAIVQWSTIEIRTDLILAGGISLIANQVWNRVDRERIVRMPSPRSETRAMEQLAIDLATDTRELGHEIDNKLAIPVAALSLLRERPGLTTDEVAGIDDALAALDALGDRIHLLHAHARERDPRIGREP